MTGTIETHPVQTRAAHQTGTGRVPTIVTMRAYEVYKQIYGEQPAMITGGCRGGFGVGEIIAFLYAYPFPKAEWRERVEGALTGMQL